MVVGFSVASRLLAAGFGVYAWDLVRNKRDEALRVFALCSTMSCPGADLPGNLGDGTFGYWTVRASGSSAPPALLVVRTGLRMLATRNVAPVRDVLILGSSPRAEQLYQTIADESDVRRVVGFMDTFDGSATNSSSSAISAGWTSSRTC